MNVFVVLREEEEKIFKRLKDYRKTTNSNQIVRESLWCYAEKIFGKSIHTGIKKRNNKHDHTPAQFAEQLEHAAETAALVAAMKAKIAEQEKQAESRESRLADVRYQARTLEQAFDRTENVRREAEAIAEAALKIVAECDAQAAKDKSFGAGAFDALAGLKL